MGKPIQDGSTKYSKTADGAYISYKELHADGIIATAKTAVDISINLIGIMALFMGFMAIAEKAGVHKAFIENYRAVFLKIIS